MSIGLTITVTGVWFYWSRASQSGIMPKPTPTLASFVKIAGAGQRVRDKILEEQAEYFDPTPLFLPTSRNFQQGFLPSRVVKQPGQVFSVFEPKLNSAETVLPNYGAVTEAGSDSLSDVLSRGNDAPFAGFGQMDRANPPLASRGGYIEVKALKNGLLSLSKVLNDAALPRVEYTPVEFMVTVASTGLIGDPIVVVTSGKEEFDGKLKDYLVNIYRIGERLLPGRYLVSVGP